MSATGRIHAGKTIKPGGRYDRCLSLLRARGGAGATTMEIVEGARVCAVNSLVSELRAMGYAIDCVPAGHSTDGGAVYRYSLAGAAPLQGDLFREGE